ncbi:Coiled-coil domain-containing protein 61 [Perkinsus olseni]|uniref:Coiled-coil domain-containing protein 61 n=1 Tax=Perkinsus olseni TaxID=32597 RepID=A0A7J6LJJ6_PEROL|nr:Coiled-coil domain-containing protein 61 [Perkinsus olseni]
MTATVAAPPPGSSPSLRLREGSSSAAGITIADRQNRIKRGVTRRFHDVDYLVEIEIEGDNLTASCEERFEGTRWTSTFSSRFIEEITHRTGNFKSFAVFVQMLFDALLDTDQQEAVQDNTTVTVDILTGRDLELLRHRNGGGVPPSQLTSRSLPDSEAKRYLILTYQASYDRVHYPLALARQEPGSDAAALLRTIKRLSRELKVLGRGTVAHRGRGGSCSAFEVRYDHAPASMLRHRAAPSKKLIARLEEENERLVRRCAELQHEIDHRGPRAGGARGQQVSELKRLRETNNRLHGDLKQLREAKMRQAQLHRNEMEKLRKELNNARGQERQLRTKIRSLEGELSRQRSRAPSSAGSLRSGEVLALLQFARRDLLGSMRLVMEREFRASPVRRFDTRTSPVRGPSPVRRAESPVARRPARSSPILKFTERPVPPTRESLASSKDTPVVATVAKSGGEVGDIDARLMALQNFLRNTMKT